MSEITIWTVVSYLAGILALFWGIISLVGSVMVAIPALIAGFIVFPPLRKRLEANVESELTDWTVFGLYLSMMIASIFLLTWLQPF
jgi:hypothetical protein